MPVAAVSGLGIPAADGLYANLGANRPGIADNKVAADHYLPASGQEVCSFPKVNQFLS